MMAIEAVLYSDEDEEPRNIVATMAFGFEHSYITGIRTPIPDRVLLDGRVFALNQTEDDENGRVAYYGELVEDTPSDSLDEYQ